jgi:hypothetical protein
MKIPTFLPIFSGFHDTLWDLDLEDITEDGEEIEVDWGKVKSAEYRDDVAKSACKILPKYFPKGMIFDCEFEEVVMSKDLYRNPDSIYCTINVNIYELRDYLYEHQEAFQQFLTDKFTSRDGFASFVSNKFEDWKSETKDFTDWLCVKPGRIGYTLQFVIDNEEKNCECTYGSTEDDFREEAKENIYYLDYIN